MEARPLRDVRRRNLYTIDALAKAAKVSTKTIVEIEHGRQTPHLATIRKISTALEVDPLEVVEFVEAIEGKLAA
ncbi:MAG TPA: helix-turn-helix transcriptional regulator [Chloroflexota bacterium]|nr:helix-turn-helix transcriptional regulator [Chloroflexota bacterium]